MNLYARLYLWSWFWHLFPLCFAINSIDTEGLPDTGLDTSDWVAGELPPLEEMWTLNDMQIAAKNVIAKRHYGEFFVLPASWKYGMRLLTEPTCISGRVSASTAIAFGMFQMSTSQHIFWATNFLLLSLLPQRPMRDTRINPPSCHSATAAGKAGILYVPSIYATKSLEEIAKVSLDGQVMFHQEYVCSNRSRLVDELKRFEDTGYKGIFLTIDNTGIDGIRSRSLRFTGAPGFSPAHSVTFDLAALAEIQNLTSLPIVPKGIQNRLLTHVLVSSSAFLRSTCPTMVDVPLIVLPRPWRSFLISNGMPQRCLSGWRCTQMAEYGGGTTVIILLALGARAVGLGRSPMFANVWGEQGVLRMIEILKAELETTMQLMGESKVKNINSSYVNTRLVDALLQDSEVQVANNLYGMSYHPLSVTVGITVIR
ncbi:FMN-dependent alpha-hydroxy acid dehydrogenase [Armillaria novae-zelandiae]|uniref:FMN-dependent alpha-hydroxy acid dehydrogenase n=1 Tax=Armillaria novae-zelandiae TaxID=153914 RepID=A0AA39PT09_9AGAR|nr:FMN-dependent alpha-hydroxy acid dehydrogenase [Armillaria novae-zelandiae]